MSTLTITSTPRERAARKRALLPALCLALAAGCSDDGGGSDTGDDAANAPPGGAGDGAMGDGDMGDGTTGNDMAGDGPTGDGDSTTTPGDDGSTPPTTADDYSYSACSVADRVGGFSVGMVQPVGLDAYTTVQGRVTDAIIPTNVPDVVMTSGECSLVMGRNLFCDPECSFDETCGEDGQCLPQPAGQDMGTVDIAGLLDGPVTMEAREPRFNYAATGTFSYPGVEEGAAVALTGAGNVGPALALQAEGVAPLAINESEVQLSNAAAASVTWNAPAVAGRSRVLATLNISLHGGDPVRIECDAEDDGSLEIPAELVSMLLTFDYSGFPAITVTRQTSEATEGPHGCIDFRVYSSVERHPVAIEGLTSCNESQDTCTGGQSCNLELMLCE